MIPSKFRHIILPIWALVVFSTTVPAQTLPSLPADSRIKKGNLPCGVAYYTVTNPSDKGYADIAVIQRDQPSSAAPLDQFSTSFLSRMGVAPGPEGYICDVDGSTVYHFRDIPFYKSDVLDSMLLYSFVQVALSKAQQAVVVSGDIDPVEIKKKMDIFSMMVPKMLVKEAHRPDYVWESSPAPWVEAYPSDSPVARVSVTYSGARVPFEYMNTAQAIVSDLFGDELQLILRHRLERNLQDAGIPHGLIDIHSLRSDDYGSDEQYTVAVTVAKENTDAAMCVLSTTLAEVDSRGVTPREFTDAKKVLTPLVRHRATDIPSRENDIRRCAANFLYGANLAPYSETMRYFSRKTLADTTETRFFNNFADALLNQLENLKLEFTGAPDSLDKDQELFNYNLAYLFGSVVPTEKDHSWKSADTLSLEVSCPKVRIKTEKKEAVTGGTLWTFTNGMRVIFKPVPGSGVFHYGLQLGGGLAQIPDLKEGEGGYIGDMLGLYDVADIPAAEFRDLLASGGVSVETELSVNSFSLKGEAPSGQLQFFLKALLAMANRRKVNPSQYQLYSQNQALAQPSVQDLLYQKLVPGFVYTANKLPGKLTLDTQKKAEKYFEGRFSRMQDGILILSGDLKEEEVKRLLLRYLGGFRTDKSSLPRRAVPLRTLSGTTQQTLEGYPSGIYFLLDAEYAVTSDHYYTSFVALEALRRSLIRHLAPYGYSIELQGNNFTQPQERFQIEIALRPIPSDNLPGDVRTQDPERALSAVHAALASCASEPLSGADISGWKARTLSQVKRELDSPSGFVTTLLTRYTSNKDIYSRYAESISAINEAQVKEYLSTLTSGGKIILLVP